jgi:replication factor C small subunit
METSIWVDKYRPKKFDEIIGQENFVKRVKSFVEKKNLPHLLFAGVPGTGKTTTAFVVVNELYGINGLRGNFLELNASDDRGIDVIRTKIKEFARLKSLTEIPYKIICLDEADSLTKDAQQALRRTMEKFSSTCRFILSCNEMSKLIDPIQSRCVIFKFKGLDKNSVFSLIEKVENEEKIKVEEEAKELLFKISKGDLRKILNTLQAASSVNSNVTKQTIEEVVDFVNPDEIKNMLNFAQKGDFFRAREEMIKLRSIRGLSGLEILKEIYKQLINMDMEPQKKIKLIDKLATTEFRLVEGSDEEIQIECLLTTLSLI